MAKQDTQSIGLLRPMANQDLEMVLEWRNAPKVRENMYTQQVISLNEHQNWWARVKDSDNAKYLIFEVDGVPTGFVSFTSVDLDHKTAEWAFFASSTAVRGTGSKMELLALDFAFSNLGLNKLNCEVLAFNTGVISLHKKFGFLEEGVFRDHKKLGGTFIDVYRLAIFATQWQDIRPKIIDNMSRRTPHA
ncbi:MAG: UDP-4-amino-4,6-dideoxy-N-acetyl-beta-L-altrosamine N-acetyltransferase [Rhodobacteraceae bacterium]|nr:UDP-4-amino-4,6-dideoxy-N-acetyl-beta-L-altrosamine N-acetyltransferase [Paracoccaceae bacterium]